MLKMLAILALSLFIFPVQTNAQPHKAQEGTSSQKPTAPAPLVPVQQTSSPRFQPEKKQHVDADVRVVDAPAKDRYDKAAFWINFVLAVVAFIGIGVGICTLLFIKRQADLMQAQFDQWIGVSGWRCWKQPRENMQRITVDLVNSTGFPITLDDGYIRLSKNAAPRNNRTLPKGTFIAPMASISIDFDVILTDAEMAAYSVALSVDADLPHVHRISQRIVPRRSSSENINCSRWMRLQEWRVTSGQVAPETPGEGSEQAN